MKFSLRGIQLSSKRITVAENYTLDRIIVTRRVFISLRYLRNTVDHSRPPARSPGRDDVQPISTKKNMIQGLDMTRLTFLPSLGNVRGRSATRRPSVAMAAGVEAVAGEGKKFKIRTRTAVYRTVTHGPIPWSLSTTK